MDAYPADSVIQNRPFLLVCGFPPSRSRDDGAENAPEDSLEASPEALPEALSLEDQYPEMKDHPIIIESDFPPVTGPVADALRAVFDAQNAAHVPWNSRGDPAHVPPHGLRVKTTGRVSVPLFRCPIPSAWN
jgi:trafficking protein particle complex subunit 11